MILAYLECSFIDLFKFDIFKEKYITLLDHPEEEFFGKSSSNKARFSTRWMSMFCTVVQSPIYSMWSPVLL